MDGTKKRQRNEQEMEHNCQYCNLDNQRRLRPRPIGLDVLPGVSGEVAPRINSPNRSCKVCISSSVSELNIGGEVDGSGLVWDELPDSA